MFRFGFFLPSLFCLMIDAEKFICCSKWGFLLVFVCQLCSVFFSSKDKTLFSLM